MTTQNPQIPTAFPKGLNKIYLNNNKEIQALFERMCELGELSSPDSVVVNINRELVGGIKRYNSKGLSGRVDDKILSRAARRQEAKLLSKTSPSITLPSYGGDAVDKFFTFVGTKLGHTPELPHYPSGNYGVVDLAKHYNKVRKFWEDGFNAASRVHVDPFNNTATFTYPTVYKTAPDWK